MSEPFDATEDARTAEGTRSRLGKRAGLGVAFAAIALAGVVAASVFGSPQDADTPMAGDADVVLPELSELEGPSGEDVTRTRLDCEPAGCEVWRSSAISGRPVVASDELAVYLGRGELVGYDVEDGTELWRRPLPEDSDVDAESSTLAAHGLAVVWRDRQQPPNSVTRTTVVSLYDSADGTHRVDVELDLDAVFELEWVDDRLVVVGLSTNGQHGDLVVVGVSPTGEIVWRHEAQRPPLLLREQEAILMTDDGVTLIDAGDGQTRWQLPGRLGSASETGGDLVVLDPESDVSVVDAATGATLQTIPVEQALQAMQLGPWIAVTTPTEVRVHDQSTGEELFRRDFETATTPEGFDPPALHSRIAAVVVDEQVIVAWTDPESSAIELATYTSGGQLEQTMSVELPDRNFGLQLHHGGERHDIVQLIGHGPAGGSVTSVNLATQEISVHEGRQPIIISNGLLVTRDDVGLHLAGLDGEIAVRHADQVASTDPLIVHGLGGILRLDRDMITRSDAP